MLSNTEDGGVLFRYIRHLARFTRNVRYLVLSLRVVNNTEFEILDLGGAPHFE